MRATLRHEGRGYNLRRTAIRAVPRLAAFALLWWVLTEGSAESWLFGVPLVIGATLASLALLPADENSGGRSLSPAGVARFAPFFVWQSLAGGTDVALRALRPGRPLDPGFVEYELRLPGRPARVFMANVASLLPGTLSAELEDRRLQVHALSHGSGVIETLEEMETRVADLFGQELGRHERPSFTDEGGEKGG